MAGAVVGAISGHLECAVCTNRFEKARFLECLHSFCEGCIEQLIDVAGYDFSLDDVKCPICRYGTNFEIQGADDLKPNLLANKIIEELQRHEQAKSNGELCKEHGAENKYFCEKCGVIICSECALCNHGKHTFLIKTVDDASKAKVDEIVKLMSKATMWLESREEFCSGYEEKKAQVNERLDGITEAIQTSYKSCIDMVTDKIGLKKDSMMEVVESSRKNFEEAVDSILIPATEAVSEVSGEIRFAGELLDSTVPKEVVLKYRDWAQRIVRTMDQQIPSEANVRRQLNSVDSIQFHESQMPVLDEPLIGFIRAKVPEKALAKNRARRSTSGENLDLQRPTRRLVLTECVQLSGRVTTMTPYKSDSILVRYRDGHMEVVHPNGNSGKIRGSNISARDMAALSDGRFVTLTKKNKVKMYGRGGDILQIHFAPKEEDESADAIATDDEDNILLIFSRVGHVERFSPEGGGPTETIHITSVKIKDPLKMSSTSFGEIVVMMVDELMVFSSDGCLCRRVPLRVADRVSCDEEGNMWMISHQDIQGTNRTFLEVYSESGYRIADTYLPQDPATPGFEPWGIAVSKRCYAALISPNEVGWIIYAM